MSAHHSVPSTQLSNPLARARGWNLAITAPLAVAIFGILLLVDVPLQRFVSSLDLPPVFHDLFRAAEVFGNGFGVLLLLLAVATLDPLGRGKVVRLAACSLGAGLVANVLKLTVSRARPHALDLAAVDVAETFSGWLPFLSAGPGGQSFPSAHTATAVGLAAGLAAAYPRGRWLFAGLAAGVGLQRIFMGWHFPSDVFVGALLGIAAAWTFVPGGLARLSQQYSFRPGA